MSDTHDQIKNLCEAIDYCNHNNIEALIHCGDLISPFMLKRLNTFKGAVHLIYGNNVGDLHLVSQMCALDFPALNHHGILGSVELAGRKIAFHHYPEVAKGIAAQAIYDIVCCGHNHIYGVEKIGGTLLVNPGDLLGKDIRPCFCVVNSETLETEKIEVGQAMFPA
jgi:hypothetical protein